MTMEKMQIISSVDHHHHHHHQPSTTTTRTRCTLSFDATSTIGSTTRLTCILILIGIVFYGFACTILLDDQQQDYDDDFSWTTKFLSSVKLTSTSSSSQQRQQQRINYRLHPDQFTETMIDCFHDITSCHIYFLHTPKTGGLDVENRMWTLFPPRMKVDNDQSSSQLDKFLEQPQKLCTAKFMSLEIDGKKFAEQVIPTCMNILNGSDERLMIDHDSINSNNSNIAKSATTSTSSSNSNTKPRLKVDPISYNAVSSAATTSTQTTTKQHRAIVLVTFREPIQRTTSKIHQKCNRDLHHRDNITQQACHRCNYNDDRQFWDQLIKNTNDEHWKLLFTVTSSISNTQILTIDTIDLQSFYHQANTIGKTKQNKRHNSASFSSTSSSNTKTYNKQQQNQQNQQNHHNIYFEDITHHANQETTQLCSFGFHSEMMKGLEYSLEMYRNLTLDDIDVMPPRPTF